jgi:thiol:disulfide interchange protein DsbC
MRLSPATRLLTVFALGALALPSLADEAAIRKAIAERMPHLPKIDEVSKTPIPGIYEVRFGTDIVYTDETGNHLIEGAIFDTKAQVDLTKARVDKLTAIDFSSLQAKDAMVFKQGNGARKLAVFADPNCGYCKRFERDLLSLKDVTIYTYLLPILGQDSTKKSRDIWCAKDKAKAWRAWMIDNVTPVQSMGACDTAALERNLELSRRHKITGTPAVVFEDGSRAPGAVPAAEIEKRLKEIAKKA